MEIVRIELGRLRGHPGNSNVMKKSLRAKLKRHIERHGHYEPLVVRPSPKEEGCYELLNGHHRKVVLEELGHEEANCVVWDVSDEEALILLATLNRLSGSDDPNKRSALLEELTQRCESGRLAAELPETAGQLQKLLDVQRRPMVIEPGSLDELPGAMTFFVSRDQRKVIEKALKVMARECVVGRGNKGHSRSELLVLLAERVIGGGGSAG